MRHVGIVHVICVVKCVECSKSSVCVCTYVVKLESECFHYVYVCCGWQNVCVSVYACMRIVFLRGGAVSQASSA